MRQIIIILLVAACQMSGQSQTKNFPLNNKGTYRVRMAAGISISSSTSHLEDHLIKSGFGDKVNGKSDWLRDNGNDYYPQTQKVPFVAELTFEKRLDKQVWLGITAGTDGSGSVKGYDRYGISYSFLEGTYSIGQFVTMEHRSWFLSPQISFGTPDGKLGFFGGPTFEFHTLGLHWEGHRLPYERPTKIGAAVGMRARFKGGLEWFATCRLSPALQYGESSNFSLDGNKSYFSTLPAAEINFSHFRTGFAYCFSW